MPMPIIVVPLYPNVPDVPGVPPLLRNPLGAISNIVLSALGSLGEILLPQALQWGIYDTSGSPVLIVSSVIALDYRKDFRISDYPIEQGAFVSYNKVETPTEIRLIVTRDGSQTDRSDFLAQLRGLQGDLNLYNVVMPEQVYSGFNVEHVDYRRTAQNGVSLLTVAISLVQIRMTGATQFTNSQQPSGADNVNGGTVQPEETPDPIAVDMLGGTP